MSEQVERVVGAEFDASDDSDFNLRPQTLNDFIGQKTVCENLSVFIRAASERDEALKECEEAQNERKQAS